MILPEKLIQAIEKKALEIPHKELFSAAKELSKRYRESSEKTESYILNVQEEIAYLCLRMPATYAAIYYVLKTVFNQFPEEKITSILDLGSGTGAGFWAGSEVFDELNTYTFIEQNQNLLEMSLNLAKEAECKAALQSHLQTYTDKLKCSLHDLVLFSYTLCEVTEEEQKKALQNAIEKTSNFIVVIEPGTPRGYKNLLKIRDLLLHEELHLLAPCPHKKQCPLASTDKWCHFYQRLPRTGLQKLLKEGSLGYEDEKFSYLVFSKKDLLKSKDRILFFPQKTSGFLKFTLCAKEGLLEEKTITKKDKEFFKKAKKLDWGDELP